MVTAIAFAGLSLWGYTTKKIFPVGVHFIMELSDDSGNGYKHIHWFRHDEMIISMLGVLIFAGLTAYDTQNIKNMYEPTPTMEIPIGWINQQLWRTKFISTF